MSQAGKFIPGGSGRKINTEKLRTGPIRAPDGADGGEPPKKGGAGNRLFQRGGGLTKPVPKNRRLPIMIMSGLVCCFLVSAGWYELGVLPARKQAQADAAAAAAAQKQLADEQAAAQAAEAARLAAAKAARATIIVASNPPGTAIIGNEHQTTPATFDDIAPGKITVIVQADGYEDYRQDMTVTAEKPTDLGTIQLTQEEGSLALSSPQNDVAYTLTGPNNYSHEGTLPDKLTGLAAGNYQLVLRQNDWQLPPMTVTIRDRDDLHKDIAFPFGILSVESTPPGATVRKDNVVLGQTPLSLPQVRPGTINLSVDLPPYTVQKFQVSILPSDTVNKQITLEPSRDFVAACGMPMVWIPDGGYWAGKYDVTQRVYALITGSNPSTFRSPNRPVETVSWDDAMAFCDKLNDEERRAGKLPNGFHYTLPTELQWETFSADANIDLAATSRNTTLSSTQEVGASEPNKYGLYDTVGNVWEWCLDTSGNDTTHSLRGGSWLSSIDNFPSADTRNSAGEKYADRFTGFRVVLVPEK
jgi:hypothetical protein